MDISQYENYVKYLTDESFPTAMKYNQKRKLREGAKSYFLRGDRLYHLRNSE